MEGFKGWEFLYQELSQKVTDNIDAVQWIDLWHNQVGFLQEEHPFTTPALFVAFRMLSADDLGELVQDANVQVDFYYFYETFLDTYQGSVNNTDALDYLKTVTEIHKLFHGFTGAHISEMRRVGFAPVDTGSAGNLYRISFAGKIIDATAKKVYHAATPGDVVITEGEAPVINKPKQFLIP
ncbi:MAG: hypothetical protein COB73_00835 [Flavobacteriaceae bacterium]|nr:MAG: hypothetical protein COB73_00835 [Flavobacteriaceae bacterium]